jgi:hypothetical protein
MVLFSRRDVLRLSASLLVCPGAQRVVAQAEAVGDLRVALAQEFARSSVKAVSPDGTRMCLEDWSERGYPLRIVEIGPWRTVYTGRFSSRIRGAPSFFADSQSLLVSDFASAAGGICGVGKGHCADREMVIDIRTGERVEGVLPFVADQYDSYHALMGRTLLDVHHGDQTESLALVEFPSCRQLTKVPYATRPRKPRPVVSGIMLSTDYGFMISSDRKTLAYAFDDVLLCRRTEDLKVLWSRSLEAGMKPFLVAVSSFGSRVAVAMADGEPLLNQQHRAYIAIYDGGTGEDVARLPRNWSDSVALSADGKFIAVVVREPGKKGEVIPTVYVYDVSSGQKLASVVHDRIKNSRHQLLEAACGVGFTSDGKYMITSGMATKVWKLGG